MAPNEQNEGKAARKAADVVNSAKSAIVKARTDKFQSEIKDLLVKEETAQAALDTIRAEIEAKCEAFDESLKS